MKSVLVLALVLTGATVSAQSDVSPRVDTRVSVAGGQYLYDFELRNPVKAALPLFSWGFRGTDDSVATAGGAPSGWESNEGPDPHAVGWTAEPELWLHPGQSVGRFHVASSGLPGILQGYALPYLLLEKREHFDSGQVEEGDPAKGVSELGYPLRFVGPAATPRGASPLELLSRIRALQLQAYELGWIDRAGILHSLDAKLRSGQSALRENRLAAARGVLNAYQNEVAAQRGKHLSTGASDLLRLNVEFLLQQL